MISNSLYIYFVTAISTTDRIRNSWSMPGIRLEYMQVWYFSRTNYGSPYGEYSRSCEFYEYIHLQVSVFESIIATISVMWYIRIYSGHNFGIMWIFIKFVTLKLKLAMTAVFPFINVITSVNWYACSIWKKISTLYKRAMKPHLDSARQFCYDDNVS